MDQIDIIINQPKSASVVGMTDFVTSDIQMISDNWHQYLSSRVKRPQTIVSIETIIQDIDMAIKIEAGLYEYALIYSQANNLSIEFIPSIYDDRLAEILSNCDTSNNPTLLADLNSSKINPQHVAFLRPRDINPKQWEELVRKQDLKEEKKKNIATTDLYQCRKCKGRRCSMREVQLRSLDEPATKFISCLDCYHVMKH